MAKYKRQKTIIQYQRQRWGKSSMPTFEEITDESEITCNSTSDNEVHLLKTKMSDLEGRYKNLIFEHERSHIELEHERRKVSQLERQLKFVKDNQAIFEKLREAYVNMKYNEATGRKLVEIRDKCVQTWDGVLCRACLDTEKLRNELEQAKLLSDDCVVIKRNEMDKINKIIQKLKNYTNNRHLEDPKIGITEDLNLEENVPQQKRVDPDTSQPKVTRYIKRGNNYCMSKLRINSDDKKQRTVNLKN